MYSCTNHESREIRTIKRVRRVELYSIRKSYGVNSQIDDMTPVAYEEAKNRFIKQLEQKQIERHTIQKNTNGQRHVSCWYEMSQNLLTSPNFAKIINARNAKAYKNILERILYKWTEYDNYCEYKHQRIEEQKALNVFKSVYAKFPLEDCGIFIDSEICYLASSPFKLYGDFILLIKCPLKQFNTDFAEAMGSLVFWKKEGGKFLINQKSPWFIEVQGELRIANRQKAFLFVWLGVENYNVFEIAKDDKFFEEEMKEKLCYFYNQVMLKEIVDSRKERCSDLREYNEELDTFM